ncbi:MAG: TonB-dependent receptor [Acidobacteria bacterium]|nr:TonB-dependent receptor [Acidobacteriota bacterium]
MRTLTLRIAFVLTAAVGAFGQAGEVRVIIRDTAGRQVVNAAAEVKTADGTARPCGSMAEGFVCRIEPGERVSVSASGFAAVEQTLSSEALASGEMNIVLEPAGLRETVVVSAERSEARLGDSPVSIAVLGRVALERTAAPTLDDALRQVPGFSTFRRSSSRNSNPTTQGVSLRGVGASGASRTAVLFDGVAINDPFGGWVQWNRISPLAVEQVEVVRGGASSLYGSGSLSGTVTIEPRSTREPFAFSGEFSAGTQETLSAAGFLGTNYRSWFADINFGRLQTEGYVPVSSEDRGPIDEAAGVRSVNLSGRFGKRFGESGSLFVRPSYFSEDRTNGTPLQRNQTHSRGIIAGGRFERAAGKLGTEFRAFGGTQVYDQTFTAVAAARDAETLSRLQSSPSQNAGLSVRVFTLLGAHSLGAGFELREVRGSSDEVGYFGGNPTSLLGTGGRERSFGVYVQDVFAWGSRAVVAGSVRYDCWANSRGLSATRSLATGITTATIFPDREEDALSPRLSVLYRITPELSLNGSASRSFRAPTLNELYRGFRVGNIVTNANADLRAERAASFEGGASFARGPVYLRGTGFFTEIDRTVANVTLTVTPSLITRQRQNAGKTRSAGFELDAEFRISRLTLNAGYLFADSRITEFPSNPSLVDRFIPQVPRHQFTFQARYAARRWDLGLQGRAAGRQFDDDQNQFRLGAFFQLDGLLNIRVNEDLGMFLAAENIFNSRYPVGLTPLSTIAAPASVRLGIRWK